MNAKDLSASNFMPHGFCMQWHPGILWLHVVSDALTALAYASIPILLLVVVRKRRDMRFSWVLLAFAGFILACGATHVMSIVTIWNPLYRLEGIVKLCTGLISVATAICLGRLIPTLLKMPSNLQLQQANEALARSHQELQHQAVQLTASYAALEVSAAANRESERHFRQLADSMPNIVWTAKPDGAVDYYNERWYVLTGAPRQLLGDQSWLPLVHPGDAQNHLKAWHSSVRSGLPFKEECRLRDRSSGTYRWHLARALPIADATGTIVKWYGATTDIDDYKAVEADVLKLNAELETRVAERTRDLTQSNGDLGRTQTWLQAILDSETEVSIIALDNDGIIRFFNSGSERLLGYKAADLIGKATPHLLYPAEVCERRARQLSVDLQRLVSVDEVFLANQTRPSFVHETVYRHLDGTRIEISSAISPMTGANGELVGRLSIAVDIRARKDLDRKLTENNLQLQEQTNRAEAANRAKSDFLSAMSHEIRTPMNSILGMADLLWETELHETQRRYVEVFRRACSNLLTLMNDILDLSKIESGRFELEQIGFDLHSLIKLILEMIQPQTDAKKLTLESDIAPDTPRTVVGDPMRLQQVLGNLLSNAVKFTESGSIRLTVAPNPVDRSSLHFQVTDTGIGIAADKIDSIFDDFIQAESSTTRRFGGTGLGLGICRRLIKQMGGQLQVRSVPGKGSSFYFNALLPSSSQEEVPPAEIVTGLAGRRVLIVDDNKTNRLIFAETCRLWDMETAECDDVACVLPALEAAALNRQAFDLVIVDRLIGDMDGLQLVAAIRQSYRQLPVLMITSDNEPGDQTLISQFGVTGYAVKPVRRTELQQLICRLLGSSNSEASRQPPRAGNFQILIADDSEDNQFLLREYLKSGPYEITFALDGKAALQLARSRTFDLILMDVQMPVMDGLEATRLIRQAEAEAGASSVPVLALSASASPEDAQLSYAAGCHGHLSKPIAGHALLTAVEKYTLQALAQAQPSFLPITVPSGLEEAAKRYIHSRRNELPQLIELVEAGDFERVRSLAHNMKGTGTSYGFPDLTRLGKLIESSAKEQDEAALSQQLLELTRYVQTAEVAVRE